MSEEDPVRLKDDPGVPELLRADLDRVVSQPALAFDVEAGLARFRASIGEGGAGEGGSAGAGGSTGTGGLRIVNWNTRNFFNDKTDDPSGHDGPGEAGLLSTSAYLVKRQMVANVIHDLSPDIAVLQELENAQVLEHLRLELQALGSDYPHSLLIPTFDIREIAILSKVPIESSKTHQDDEFVAPGTFAPTYSYTRDCLEAHMTWNGRKLVILGVHFRSKFDPDDPQKRLAEAAHTRKIADGIAAADPEAGILILGDFNDLPNSPPYNAVIGSGMGAYTNASVLALPESSRWTYKYMGMLELIDQQMSNPLLAGMLDTASIKIPHTASVEDASDHAPVSATYNVK
ncbi:MAG: endonuclease/exonuclease/phosphatase family protein [Polyangiaceae bacterium]|nr:endonuclease/exonuclease/phosphatase family protein [Polyangiaceae bacterium]